MTKNFRVWLDCPVAKLLEKNTLCDAVKEVRSLIEKTGVTVNFWSNNTVTFGAFYAHTINVPAKAAKDIDGWKNWTLSRIKKYYSQDWGRVME